MKCDLSELQKDFLSEMVNIAYGKATARIAQILDAFATMGVPSIRYATKSDLLSEIKQKQICHNECYLTMQNFIGKFDGETIFLISDDSAKNLLAHLKNDNGDESMQDSIVELANIVTALLISELAKNLDSDIYFNDPSFLRLHTQDNLEKTLQAQYEHIIAIDTIMEFRDQNIHGHIYILTHDKSFDWLLMTLNKKIKEFGL